MKLSVETKVAALIAVGFLAVGVGVVAQTDGAATASTSDNYELTSNPRVHTDMISQEYDGLIPDRSRSGTGPPQAAPVSVVDGVPGL
ncbi:MAG: hypothetical protein ACM3KL_06830 [Alphaproteobacteria bacterium]